MSITFYVCKCLAGVRLAVERDGGQLRACDAQHCACSCHRPDALLPFAPEALNTAELRELALRTHDAQSYVWSLIQTGSRFHDWWSELASMQLGIDAEIMRRLT